MKLRRSLALAAATAAIAPAVLLAAPVAYASDDDSPAPTVTETAPTEEESTPAADQMTPAADDTTPAAQEATPAADETTPVVSQSSSPSASATVSSSPSVSASASASAGPVECTGDEPKIDKNLHTTLSGLPSKIVAGSGFHGFKLNVNNTGDRAYQRVDLGIFAAQMDEKDYFIDTSHLTLQYKDPSSGKWVGISLDENDEGAGYLGYTDVKAHESFSIEMRLAVDKSAPAGLGYAISIGMYADDKGNCVFSGDDSYYEFDILKAGTAPGHPGDAKPQGGKKPLPEHQPTGNNKIEPQGHLAQTGSSSALPSIALAGGAAVAIGAGAVFVVRRRKTVGSDTTV
ncbi:LAETG motif-containing sortase-dependent surface protein [Streptomyces sp. NPDC003388]|uniref:LAETG motif-containing sortase-dependent surface protein n=1 Tax=Streptomyces sp. ATE26 TaxID=2954237 RepID=UPI0024830CA8|nr:LAETG motif-containing sortase-dependent surface protein [Streptomyces sp. ATE26]MDI1456468.1 LAETG motif-containing sortase-dependent surface protein [Streptomyces sp. ATE26]